VAQDLQAKQLPTQFPVVAGQHVHN